MALDLEIWIPIGDAILRNNEPFFEHYEVIKDGRDDQIQ